MKYRDIIERMKRDGHYHEAESLERSIGRGYGSTESTFHGRSEAADGLSYCGYARDCAEQAYDGIKGDERRAEQRREEEAQERRRLEYEQEQRHEAERHRQEEEAYWEYVNQQVPDATERESQPEQEQP